jgi:hypothetical protein
MDDSSPAIPWIIKIGMSHVYHSALDDPEIRLQETNQALQAANVDQQRRMGQHLPAKMQQWLRRVLPLGCSALE